MKENKVAPPSTHLRSTDKTYANFLLTVSGPPPARFEMPPSIAAHSLSHHRISAVTPARFREDSLDCCFTLRILVPISFPDAHEHDINA